MLQLLKRSCTRCVEASALFMDELASVLKKGCLDLQVEVSIDVSRIVDKSLQNTWTAMLLLHKSKSETEALLLLRSEMRNECYPGKM